MLLLSGCAWQAPASISRGDESAPNQAAPGEAAHSKGGRRFSARPAAPAKLVKLEVGHCIVEPVSFHGRTWALPWDKQFGWGGGIPDGWKGTGTVRASSEDRVRYHDRGGSELTMVPADSPSALAPEGWGCA